MTSIFQGISRFVFQLAIVSCSLSALAQDVANKPDLQLGDEWVYVQTGTEYGRPVNRQWQMKIVERLPDDKIRVSPKVSFFEIFDRSWNPIHPDRPHYLPTEFKFPARVGDAWTYASPFGSVSVTGRGFEQRGNYKVVALESITVPAGTFKCFRIEGESSYIGAEAHGPDYKFVRRIVITRWYCPDIKNTAKVHFVRSSTGSGFKQTYEELDSELLEFRPGTPVALAEVPPPTK